MFFTEKDNCTRARGHPPANRVPADGWFAWNEKIDPLAGNEALALVLRNLKLQEPNGRSQERRARHTSEASARFRRGSGQRGK